MRSIRQVWKARVISILRDSESAEIDVDEGIRFAVVAAAGNDAEAPLDQAPHDAKVLAAGVDRHRLATRMLRTGGREPIAALVKAAGQSARFAGAGAARFSELDGLLDLGFRGVGQAAAPVEAKRAVFRFDVLRGEPVALR
jgi:hypothetical protein